MRKNIVWFMLIIVILGTPVFAFQKILKATTNKKSGIAANIEFLTKGATNFDKSGIRGKSYRIYFWRDEIYDSVIFEEIQLDASVNPEGEEKVVAKATLIGEDLRDFLHQKGEIFTNLNFVKWINWNTALIQIDGQLVKLSINSGNQQFKIVFEKVQR